MQLSATGIQLWTDCKRKWGFRYLEHIELLPHPSAVLGKRTHEQLGRYLTGHGFDFTCTSGEIANAMAPMLPVPTRWPGFRIEREFTIPSPTGKWSYRGFIDLWAPDSGVVPGLDGGRPLVSDFKTTGNLAYAQTSETLATNIQAQLYAMAMMFEENVNELDLVWFYGRTRKPHRTQRVHLRVTAPQVVEQFERIEAIAAEINAVTATKAEELPPNVRMCDQYGGCPYRHLCNLSPSAHAEGINNEAKEMNTSSFLDKLRRNPAVAPPAPAVVAPPAPAAVMVVAPVAVAPPALLMVTPPVPDAITHAALLPSWALGTKPYSGAAAAINPPESALPPAPPVGIAAPAEPKRRGRPPKAATTAPVEAPTTEEIYVTPSQPVKFPFADCANFLRMLAVWLDTLA